MHVDSKASSIMATIVRKILYTLHDKNEEQLPNLLQGPRWTGLLVHYQTSWHQPRTEKKPNYQRYIPKN